MYAGSLHQAYPRIDTFSYDTNDSQSSLTRYRISKACNDYPTSVEASINASQG